MTTLFVETTFSLFTLIGIAIFAFGAGFLFKLAVVRKQRKRILNLEDEMLSNHARILSLEKKISESAKDKNAVQHNFDLNIKSDRDLKAI
jgi:hypothetical protein